MKKNIILLFLFLSLLGVVFANIPLTFALTFQDFTTYTETDEDSVITVDSGTKVSFVEMERNDRGFVWSDFGIDYFNDFVHFISFNITSIDAGDSTIRAAIGIWVLAISGDAEDWGSLAVNSLGAVINQVGSSSTLLDFNVQERGVAGGAQVRLDVGTQYYATINKTGTAFFGSIYSDEARTVLVGTSTLTITDNSYRYCEVAVSMDLAQDGTDDISGYVENLAFQQTYTLTFNFTVGGEFWVDGEDVVNGSTSTQIEDTVYNFGGLPLNSSYLWLNFTMIGTNTTINSTVNPYNHTLTQNATAWCYFGEAGEGEEVTYTSAILVGALCLFIPAGAIVYAWRKH